jgi:hypothetical protein
MGWGSADRTHFVETNALTSSRDLPRSFASGKPAANDAYLTVHADILAANANCANHAFGRVST